MLTRRPDAETPNPLHSAAPAVGATAVPTTENPSQVHIEDRIWQLLADIPTGREPVAAMYVLLYDNAEGIAEFASTAREMLRFGEHDGLCTNHDDASGTEGCVLHAEAFELRAAALRNALAKLDGVAGG